MKKRHITLRLSIRQYEELYTEYEKYRYNSFSEFIRKKLTNNAISYRRERNELNTLLEVNPLLRNLINIGTNINQIAKKVNSQNYALKEDIKETTVVLKKMTAKINKLKYIMQMK